MELHSSAAVQNLDGSRTSPRQRDRGLSRELPVFARLPSVVDSQSKVGLDQVATTLNRQGDRSDANDRGRVPLRCRTLSL